MKHFSLLRSCAYFFLLFFPWWLRENQVERSDGSWFMNRRAVWTARPFPDRQLEHCSSPDFRRWLTIGPTEFTRNEITIHFSQFSIFPFVLSACKPRRFQISEVSSFVFFHWIVDITWTGESTEWLILHLTTIITCRIYLSPQMLSTSSDACANHAMATNNSISPGESRRADAATGWLGRIVGGGGRFNIFKKWIKCRDPTAVCNPPFPDEQTYHAGFFPAPRLASAMTTEFSALQTPTPPTHEPSNSSIGRKRAIELINSSSPSISI